jgi:hypothetical protein
MGYELPQHRQEITVSAGTAFKAGFFGFFGMFLASLIVSVIMFVGILLLSLVLSATLISLFE